MASLELRGDKKGVALYAGGAMFENSEFPIFFEWPSLIGSIFSLGGALVGRVGSGLGVKWSSTSSTLPFGADSEDFSAKSRLVCPL